MALFKGSNWSQVKEDLFTTDFDLDEFQPVIEYAQINEAIGTCLLVFRYHPKGLPSYNIVINSSTMQDIIMALGPPSERFFKEDSRLSIHNPLEGDDKGMLVLLLLHYRALTHIEIKPYCSSITFLWA